MTWPMIILIDAFCFIYIFLYFLSALGNLKTASDKVRECLIWAFRYEEQPGVRAEACHTLIRLGLKDDDVVHILQERYLVENNEIVRR